LAKAIGIDLGITNSVAAVMEADAPTIIVNSEGGRVTPSVVAFTKTGERIVGQIAKRQAALNPERTIYSIKRFMGRKYSEVTEELKQVQCLRRDLGVNFNGAAIILDLVTRIERLKDELLEMQRRGISDG